jgi:4-hydroxybenzoate polyprenyltransferase
VEDSATSRRAAVLAGHETRGATRVSTAWRLLRCPEWLKNVFVFAGILFTGPPLGLDRIEQSAFAFLLFSLAASAVYIHNDIADRESDRRHPVKRLRPIAAGRVSLGMARAVQAVLLVAAFGGAMLLPARFSWLLAVYVGLNVAYTAVLKQMLILDVMALAAGFVLRVEAGCAAIGAEGSSWILLCTFLLAVFMGFGKRRHELLRVGVVSARPGDPDRYSAPLLDQMMGIASACTIVGYAIFTTSWRTVSVHGTTNLVYTVPFVVYGIFRYQLLVMQDGGGGDPTELVLGDMPLLTTIVLWLTVCVGVLYWA